MPSTQSEKCVCVRACVCENISIHILYCGNHDRRQLSFPKETLKQGLRVSDFNLCTSRGNKGKTKVNMSSSSYGVKRVGLRSVLSQVG